MLICSDVDGVILNYKQGFIDFTKQEQIEYRYDPETYGVVTGHPRARQLRKRFHAGDSLKQLEYYDGALEVLNRLAEQSELHLVTALDPDCGEMRAQNLSALNYTSLQCVGDALKQQVIIDDIQPDVMIEDRPELIQAFHDAGIQVFYPDWHRYTRGMGSYGTAFSSWGKLSTKLLSEGN